MRKKIHAKKAPFPFIAQPNVRSQRMRKGRTSLDQAFAIGRQFPWQVRYFHLQAAVQPEKSPKDAKMQELSAKLTKYR
ncbi:hypothetical protein XYCOK13_30380 [Xylanibacillus composti]|uniref:Uncharacterized protein n=1 Tax=Xylanibacillus composti TaxID=1572762 RepID=A0A8J4H3J5_9BACL|nr:hypothetical protein XYCOK13_30380 [Xylanibacillus composti]